MPAGSSDVPSSAPRYGFLDLYRGLFVLIMLEGHAARELLSPAAKATDAFALHELLHGLTGPGFFFGAGFTFTISTQRRWAQLLSSPTEFTKRVGRVLALIIIGYALHIPFLSLSKTLAQATPTQITFLWSFGVLQCIGFSLLLLYFLLAVLRDETALIAGIVLALLAVVTASPALWRWSLTAPLPRFVSAMFNTLSGSPFPIIPFSGFVLAGALTSWLFLRSTQWERTHRFMLGALFIGLLLIGTSVLTELTGPEPFSSPIFWSVSQTYFWLRTGMLLLLLAALWAFEQRLHRYHAFWLPRWIVLVGIESFFVYIVHLVLLYGWASNPLFNIRSWFGNNLSVFSMLVVLAPLVLICIALAAVWHWFKRSHPILRKGIYVWFVFMLLWSFLMNPY